MAQLIRESFFFRFFAALCRFFVHGWQESALCRWLDRFDRWLCRQARESRICRFFAREGALPRAWRNSWTAKLLYLLANLIPRVLSLIYRRFRALLEDSFCVRFLLALGENTPAALSWVTLVLLCTPHEVWNNTYSLLLVLAVLALLWLSGMRRRSLRLVPDAINPYFYFYALLLCFAVVISGDRGGSLRALAFSATGMLAALLLVSTVKEVGQFKRVAAFAAMGMAVASAYAFYQRIDGVKVNASYVDVMANAGMPGRVYSFFENPNTFAQLLVLLLPLVIALIFASRSVPGKLAAAAAAAMGIVCLGMTYSRASWIGIVAAGLCFLFLWHRKLVLPAIFLGLCAIPFLPTTIFNRILTIFNPSDSSTSGRMPIYRSALACILDRPGGVGLGSDVAANIIQSSGYYDGRFKFAHVHNILLEISVEAGVLAGLSFLGSLITAGKDAIRALTAPSCDRALRFLMNGALSGLVGVMVCGMADYIWHYPRLQVIFWIVFGLLCAGVRAAQSSAAEK